MLLVGCSTTGSQNSSKNDSEQVSVTSSSQGNEKDGINIIEESDVNEIFRAKAGGILTDIANNTFIQTGAELEFTLSPNTNDDKTVTFKVSDTTVLEIITKGSMHFFKGLKASDVIFSAYDVDGILCYRKIIRVRDAIAENGDPDLAAKFQKQLYEQDYWKSHRYDNYRTTFITTEEGVLTGYDDLAGNIETHFIITYDKYDPSWNMQVFVASTTTITGDLKVGFLYIAMTGDMLLLYDQLGYLISIFYGSDYLHLH